jgi:glucan phosphorylase
LNKTKGCLIANFATVPALPNPEEWTAKAMLNITHWAIFHRTVRAEYAQKIWYIDKTQL